MNLDVSIRKRWSLIPAFAVALSCCADVRAAMPGQAWRIDESHTSISFKIDAVGFPTTHGRFTHYSGRIVLDFESPAKSFTSFTVESTSVDAGSRSFNDFLKSSVLLNTARFPTLSFTSTAIEKLGAHTARVAGNLTMLDVTKPIALIVDVETDRSARRGAIAFTANSTIRRSEFGMIFGLPLIDDAIEITIKTRALADE
jgi:polyisoprenoid-binding protein YceI